MMEPRTLDVYRAPADLLDGRVILITGATGGIGRAVALQAASLGARLVLLGRDADALSALHDEIVDAGGADPTLCALDLLKADENSFTQLVDQVGETHGRLDGLVHCAGMLGTLSPLEHQTFAEWYQVMQVNLNAAFGLLHGGLPLLRRSEDPSVVLVSSGVGREGRAFWGAYSVSKFGTEALAQILADETEGSVRVNALNPGPVRTRMRAKAYPGEDPDSLPEPEDIAWAFIYLLGPDSRAVHGQSLDVPR